MRPQDLKVQVIARQTGMLYMHEGIEYSKPVTVGDLTMEFEFSNPEDMAYIAVYKEGVKRAVGMYYEDLEDVRNDYPQFFN